MTSFFSLQSNRLIYFRQIIRYIFAFQYLDVDKLNHIQYFAMDKLDHILVSTLPLDHIRNMFDNYLSGSSFHPSMIVLTEKNPSELDKVEWIKFGKVIIRTTCNKER